MKKLPNRQKLKKNKKLKIAIFCATEFSVPPTKKMKDIYAPIWLTHYITEELTRRGHKITLFAPSNSKTKAKLVSDGLTSLATNKELKRFYRQVPEIRRKKFYQKLLARRGIIDNYDYLLLSKLYQEALKRKFDIIYISLIGLRPLPFAALCPTPTVFSLNSPLGSFSKFFFRQYKKKYPQIHFVALTKSHAKAAPNLFKAIVNNGIKIENFKFNQKPKNYLLISGRIAREKGIYEAIKIAKLAKEKLIIIGRKTEDNYWHKKVKPYLGKNIKFKGFVPYYEMPKYYKNAKAFLFPLRWEEPFGLTMIEAMACGTPVIAFDRGSVKEIVKNGKTGFVVPPFAKGKRINFTGAVKAIKKINQIDRYECRKLVEENFTIEKMVDSYEELFFRILKRR